MFTDTAVGKQGLFPVQESVRVPNVLPGLNPVASTLAENEPGAVSELGEALTPFEPVICTFTGPFVTTIVIDWDWTFWPATTVTLTEEGEAEMLAPCTDKLT